MKKVLIGLASTIFAVGCGGTTKPPGGNCAQGAGGGTAESKLVANSVLLPTSTTPYQYDFDGSMKKKNILGTLLGLLGTGSGAGTPQGSVDKAVKTDGSFLLLIDAKADAFTTDTCAQLDVSYATTLASPKLDGTGTFTIASTAGEVDGPITAGTLDSLASATATTPANLKVNLPLLDGSPPLILDLTAVHVTGTFGSDGKTITNGVINGAIKNTDLRTTVFPAVAAALTKLITSPDCTTSAGGTPPGCSQPSTKMLINTSINTGCGAGMTGKGDMEITLCEIKEGLVGMALSPDLDLFSDVTTDATTGESTGSYAAYKPTPPDANASSADQKKAKDSVSFGIGFTAVAATF